MRGEVDSQGAMFCYVSAERRIPADQPLRSIKVYADQALGAISASLTRSIAARADRRLRRSGC